LWESDSTLAEHGGFVILLERMAVGMLMPVTSMEPTVVDDFVVLVRVDRALAQTAVDKARAAGGAPDLIRIAEEKLAEGDEFVAREKYSMAISR
jgi:hypothetical protein